MLTTSEPELRYERFRWVYPCGTAYEPLGAGPSRRAVTLGLTGKRLNTWADSL